MVGKIVAQRLYDMSATTGPHILAQRNTHGGIYVSPCAVRSDRLFMSRHGEWGHPEQGGAEIAASARLSGG
jgi:hypothetical protein